MNIVCIINIIIKIVIGTGFPGDTVTNNPPPNAGDARDMDLIPGSGRYPEAGNGNCSNILAWKIPWTEEP